MPRTTNCLGCARCDGMTYVQRSKHVSIEVGDRVVPAYQRSRSCNHCGALMHTVELRVSDLPNEVK